MEYMVTIAVQTATLLFIIITLVQNKAVSLAIKKNCVFHFWLWVKIPNGIYTAKAIIFHILEDDGIENPKKHHKVVYSCERKSKGIQ